MLSLRIYIRLYLCFRESAQNISRRLIDQPLSSLDKAIYWIEYVIKYGNDVLRSPAVNMPWYQLYLVDVIAFLLLCALSIIAVVIFVVRAILKVTTNHGKTIQMNNSESKKMK